MLVEFQGAFNVMRDLHKLLCLPPSYFRSTVVRIYSVFIGGRLGVGNDIRQCD